ncbi:MAG: YopT-type cysteine protease domain-containing protein [Pseudomonadales bacterium]|nr:YopT-type cysteine protease domain-containing protein [Pseudomonadales bacterium]
MSFNKTKLIAAIRDSGSGDLIHFYDQGQDDRLNKMDLTEDGWCHGMAVKWLEFKKQKGIADETFWPWVASDKAGPAFRFIMVDQTIRSKVGNAKDSNEKTIAHLRRKGPLAYLKDHDQWGTNPQPQALANDVVNTPGNFARIGMYYISGGGHAIAAVIKDKHVWFMDPNAGEVKVKKENFAKFFKNFWKVRYPTSHLKSYYVEKYNG